MALKQSLKNVAIFFVLVFLQTWLCYFMIILWGLNAREGLGMMFLVVGGMAPSFVGVILALATYNKPNIKEYFRRFYQVKRIGLGWWTFILLIFPAIHAGTVLITLLTGGAVPGFEGLQSVLQNPASIPMVLLLGFFINGAWPEEWGWRGFALQPLLNRFGFMRANLLLGALWALWHLPLFFMPAMAHAQMGFVGFWFFLAQSVGLSMIMGLVFLKTKQSILSALLLHMLYNLTYNMAEDFSQQYERISFVLVFVVGVVMGLTMKKNYSMPIETAPKAINDDCATK